ncbi:MAG: hypothetical protein IPL79_03500 [Myxococcales bacterium]|nr:hypothetical protein [Myxococcales bacterium]
MASAKLLTTLIVTMVFTQVAAAAPRGEVTQHPATKAKQLLTKARLAKVRPIRDATNEKSLAYKRGATDVELAIGPTSHGPLAFWTVKTTKGNTTTEASTVVDAPYPFATTYRTTQRRANGDLAFESIDISRTGYEGMPDQAKPVTTSMKRTLSRTAKNGVGLSVSDTYRFGKRMPKQLAPAARTLEISSQGAFASIDLLATTPALTGSITALAADALTELKAFLALPELGLAAAAIEGIAAVVTASPTVAVNADPLADIRAKIKLTMASW